MAPIIWFLFGRLYFAASNIPAVLGYIHNIHWVFTPLSLGPADTKIVTLKHSLEESKSGLAQILWNDFTLKTFRMGREIIDSFIRCARPLTAVIWPIAKAIHKLSDSLQCLRLGFDSALFLSTWAGRLRHPVNCGKWHFFRSRHLGHKASYRSILSVSSTCIPHFYRPHTHDLHSLW